MLSGQASTGFVVSTTWMVWLQVMKLWQVSSAFQVRVWSYVPAQLAGVIASEKVTARSVSQLSLNCGVPKLGCAGHSMVCSPGQEATVGLVVSLTVSFCVAVAVLPQSSVAVHVRVISYVHAV